MLTLKNNSTFVLVDVAVAVNISPKDQQTVRLSSGQNFTKEINN